MGYYRTLGVILVVFLLSVVVQDGYLFQDEFFLVAYIIMAFVMVAGSKYGESFEADVLLGMFLIFSVGFLSTDVLIRLFTNPFTEVVFFKLSVVLSLDVCGLSFLHLGMKYKKEHLEFRKREKSMFRKVEE